MPTLSESSRARDVDHADRDIGHARAHRGDEGRARKGTDDAGRIGVVRDTPMARISRSDGMVSPTRRLRSVMSDGRTSPITVPMTNTTTGVAVTGQEQCRQERRAAI
jgi:hypothetical protein